jgi:hypothetical protein
MTGAWIIVGTCGVQYRARSYLGSRIGRVDGSASVAFKTHGRESGGWNRLAVCGRKQIA